MFTFSLGDLSPDDAPTAQGQGLSAPSTDSKEIYRRKWRWDKVAWGTHCVNCYPGNCPYRVYVRDGLVRFEEPGGTFSAIEEGVPDFNPMGCQKGAAWSQMLYAPERVLYPLKRAGERGEGKWQRISWDEALTEVADAIIDAIREGGPETIINQGSPAEGGLISITCGGKFFNLLGALSTDVNGSINDFNTGLHITFGKFHIASSVDDWFHAQLTLIWHANPAYTRIPYYHFITESRYNGGEVVTISPDFTATAALSDYFVSVKPGSDAALALAMCRVIVDEGLYDVPFMKEQTDLPLLVRLDNRRFLREADLQDRGRDDQLYFFDVKSQRVVPAPRGSLALEDTDPALEGRYQVKLRDGRQVEVAPVFQLVKEKLADYQPEAASSICGVHPDIIRNLARKVARKRTNILLGFNSCKYYHGDLMERSMCLLLGLTGNWGKKGTGIGSWSPGMFDGSYIFSVKQRSGPEHAREILAGVARMWQSMKAQDPTLTDELAAINLQYQMAMLERNVAPVFLWYYHCGYREIWNRKDYNDPDMRRSFDEYLSEAVQKRWWLALPNDRIQPRVFFEVGGNSLRRTRGGQTTLLKHLWPKLKMIVTVDTRMQTTALYSDIFLPVATNYEKVTFQSCSPHTLLLVLNDKVADPPGEAKSEFEIYRLLAQKVEERAKARGFVEYKDIGGRVRRLDNLYAAFTAGGTFDNEEKVADEWVRDSAVADTLPQGASLETLRQQGFLRFTNWGISPFGLGQAADLKPNETHAALRWHTEKKMPYPTFSRRVQFYIDHEWFLEAQEELPVYKENPKIGGNRPFILTSGHQRASIHTINVVNKIMLETHRGYPVLFINNKDAEKKDIQDGDEVEVTSDMGSFRVHVKVSGVVQPGQVLIYNGWEPYMFPNWQDTASLEPGMVKYLHLAGGYGHLRYRQICWQPVQFDRGIHVDVSKVG